jgi:hypothetical protein
MQWDDCNILCVERVNTVFADVCGCLDKLLVLNMYVLLKTNSFSRCFTLILEFSFCLSFFRHQHRPSLWRVLSDNMSDI